MALPPLRTVSRGPGPAGEPAAAATPAASARVAAPRGPVMPLLESTRLTPEVRGFFSELLTAGLLTATEVGDLLSKLGDRLPQLTTRDRASDALVGHGFLSRYQAERARGGFTHGLVLGNYRLLERISGGTVGIVFMGEHAVMKRRVAVKVLPADDTASADSIRRFQVEARLLAGLTHPHVVTAYDAGLLPAAAGQQDLHYLVLELITGGDLEQHVYRHGARPPAVVAEWGRQIASGLHAAHTAGLVHRDIKPSNVLLTEGLQAKITDFGLARELTSTATRHGTLLGTLEFMAPEQFADAPTCGPPADVYGLGATLFWVLTGKLPFEQARTIPEAVAAIKSGQPRKLRQVDPDQPAELATVIDKMLARNPADRPTATEVVQALEPLAAGSVLLADAGAAAVPADNPDRLRETVAQLEQTVKAKAADADRAWRGLVAGLVAAAVRPDEPPGHQKRVGAYTRAMCQVLARHPDWAMLKDPKHLDEIARAATAHDIGLAVSPADGSASTPDSEAHTRLGDDLLTAVAQASGPALPWLRTLRAVVRHHHERWDGNGFPDRLAGAAIPPAARLVAVAVAYDDLRREHPLHTHTQAVARIRTGAGTAFDLHVVTAFLDAAHEFERVYAVVPDREGQPAPGAVPAPPPDTPSPAAGPASSRLRWVPPVKQ